jgi:hypothetical protein
MGLNMKLLNLLENPIEFFENIKDKDWKHAFKFFLIITIILSPILVIVVDIYSLYSSFKILHILIEVLYGILAFKLNS